jgi:hypothetical protein
MKSKSEMKRVAVTNPILMAETCFKLTKRVQDLEETLRLVKNCDPYPDLSYSKYFEAYSLIREKINQVLEDKKFDWRIKNE